MCDRFYISTEGSIRTLGPVTFAIEVPVRYQKSADVLQGFLAGKMAENLNISKDRLVFEKTADFRFHCKVVI
jgi:hypothetical protein